MLCGLMDHWVPSADAVSRFWKTPFETLEPLMARLCDEVAIDHFTFYTKWYTNGFRSRLPFLPNHPKSENVRTGNDWGRRWIEFFHRRGMTVGAMIQSYAYLPGCFPAEHTLGTWKDTHRCTGLTPDQDNVIIDPAWEGFTAHFEAMLEEQIRLFPGLDAVFLEFEGLPCVEPKSGGSSQLQLWSRDALVPESLNSQSRAAPRPGRGRPGSRRTKPAAAPISPAIRTQWADSAWDVPERDQWIWTEPVQAILADRLRVHLAAAERVFARVGYQGIRGVVYHAMNYETPYLTSCLPRSSPERNGFAVPAGTVTGSAPRVCEADWWLLPWHYWGWDFCRDTPDAVVRRQIDWCQAQFRARIGEGWPLCYIGNATLPTERYDSIREMIEFCRNSGAAGHLGMGNPIPGYGLRWHGATEEGVGRARSLYRDLFTVKAGPRI